MGKKLSEITDDELRAEMERRTKQPGQIDRPNLINPVADPDFTALRNMIVDIVKDACNNSCWPKDHKQYIFELAMTTVFGSGFWDWKNSVQWEGE